MVLTAYFVLSPAIGLVCHRHLRVWRRLDAGVEASGPHDFAVRVSTVRQPALPASTASRPASVTIAIRPSVGWDAKSSRCDLGWTETEIFLQRGLDTPVNKPPVGQISKYVRMG
jgi:hypothetical protein